MGSSGSFLSYFGAELRHCRERDGLTQTEVGAKCGYGNGLISKIERAERVPQPELCAALDELFGTDGFFARLGIEVREHAIPFARHRAYFDREADAVAIHTYESHLVPGLLQTEEYARAVVGFARPQPTPAEADMRVAVRMTRQEVLNRDSPPRLWAILDESVLHREVGSRRILRCQLQRLLAMTEQPHITIQVHPFSAGASPAWGTDFLLAEFSSGESMFHIDPPSGLRPTGEPDAITRYRILLDHLRAFALPEDRSAAMIQSRIDALT